MATVLDLWNALQSTIAAEVADVTPDCTVFIDEPQSQQISDLSRGGNQLIKIFDLNMSRNKTRWPTLNLYATLPPTALVSTLSIGALLQGTPQTITLSGGINLNDSVSCVVQNGLVTKAQVYKSIAGDTFASIATNLAGLLNADPTVSTWLTASATGPVITLTSLVNAPLILQSYTGNQATRLREVARVDRFIQISSFSTQAADRNVLGNILMEYIANLQAGFGLQMPDQTWARVTYNSDRPSRDTHYGDYWRWDFLICCEVGITTQDVLYSVLAPIPQFTLP